MAARTCKTFIFAMGTLSFLYAQDPMPLFRTETRIVALHATVRGPEGSMRIDLPRSSFRVFEDGVEQKIDSFRGDRVPVSLGFLIDTSASMADKRADVIDAAKTLLKYSRPDDEFFVVRFNDEAQVVAHATNQKDRLNEWLTFSETNGETAMRDALRVGLDYVAGRQKDKRVLVLITDGIDNRSRETLDRLLVSAQREEVVVFAVIFRGDNPKENELARRGVDRLTESTGGAAYYPLDASELKQIAPRIAEEIRNQYTLMYRPSNVAEDGSFRQIRLVVSVPGASVRTRTGYYATKRTGASD
jgi:VWFA-related protein